MPPRSTDEDRRDATEIAANAAADAGVQPIDNPARRATNPNARRADVRGVYADRAGERRVVGPGDVIPDGWELIEETDLAARASTTPSARTDEQVAATGVSDADHNAALERAEAAEAQVAEARDAQAKAEAAAAEAQKRAEAAEAQVAEARDAQAKAEAAAAEAQKRAEAAEKAAKK